MMAPSKLASLLAMRRQGWFVHHRAHARRADGGAGSVPFSFKKIDEMDEVGATAQLVGIAAPSANQRIALAELRQRWWHTTRLAAVTVPPASARNRTGTPSRQKGQNRRNQNFLKPVIKHMPR